MALASIQRSRSTKRTAVASPFMALVGIQGQSGMKQDMSS